LKHWPVHFFSICVIGASWPHIFLGKYFAL
jgi:hypothetical protein